MTPTDTWAQDEAKRLCAALTDKEREVLVLFAKGFSRTEVARLVSRGPATVDIRMQAARDRLEVETTIEAAVLAAKAGLV